MKYFSGGLPFGSKKVYAKKVSAASLENLVHLIKICGFLMQPKIHLFWSSAHERTEKGKRAQL